MKRQKIKVGYKIRDTRYGFTIVEMLLVVVVIALVAGASGRIWLGTYKNMLARKSARELLLAAKYARMLAIERQSPCRIILDAENNRFWLVINEFSEETGQTEQVIVRDLYFKPVEFDSSVKFENIQIAPTGLEQTSEAGEEAAIVFQPDGTTRSAVIQIGNDKNHYTVSISAATGKAKMHFGQTKDAKISVIDLDEQ